MRGPPLDCSIHHGRQPIARLRCEQRLRCLDAPGSSTAGVCDVERREDLEGRGIVFVLMNLNGKKEGKS